jgi:hypothetical protein
VQGGTVDAVVSLGPERYDVPFLRNKSLSQVGTILEDRHLTLGTVTEVWSETIKKGLVISSTPRAGTEMRPDAPVAVNVSKGPQPIKIPDFTGKSAERAEARLGELGFTVNKTEENSDTVDKGKVISQDPDKGKGHKGDEIDLVVSKGPVMVEVPSLRAMSVTEATPDARRAGLRRRGPAQRPLHRARPRRPAEPRVGRVPPQGQHRHRLRRLMTTASSGRLSPRATGLVATVALLFVTATWGSTFFLIKDLLDRVPVLDFLAVRFAIATATLLVLFPRAVGRLSARSRRAALVLGALYGLGQILQTAGLAHTPASVVRVHHRDVRRRHPPVRGSAAQAAHRPHHLARRCSSPWSGLGVLSLSGFSIGYGEALTLVAALLYALHIVGLGAWSRSEDAIGLTIVQLAVITVISFVVTAPGRRGAPGPAG